LENRAKVDGESSCSVVSDWLVWSVWSVLNMCPIVIPRLSSKLRVTTRKCPGLAIGDHGRNYC
jgi:hypothetical protein